MYRRRLSYLRLFHPHTDFMSSRASIAREGSHSRTAQKSRQQDRSFPLASIPAGMVFVKSFIKARSFAGLWLGLIVTGKFWGKFSHNEFLQQIADRRLADSDG